MAALFVKTIRTPLGMLRLSATRDALVGVELPAGHPLLPHDGRGMGGNPVLERAEKELGEYFRGERTEFSVPTAADGTDFQRSVWHALKDIPFGETRSYAWIAQQTGHPRAFRAVGSANHCNPLPIVVPCHRVIGADGSLSGYGGGVDAKRWLLDHESRVLGATRRAAG